MFLINFTAKRSQICFEMYKSEYQMKYSLTINEYLEFSTKVIRDNTLKILKKGKPMKTFFKMFDQYFPIIRNAKSV